MLTCPVYDDFRCDVIYKAYAFNVDVISMSGNDKKCFLFSNVILIFNKDAKYY